LIDYGVYEGAICGHTFFNFIVNELLPHLSPYPGPNSVLILDNVNMHNYEPFTSLMEYLGVRIIYLPAYCPFLNIIELYFNIIKMGIRRFGLRYSQQIVRTIVYLFEYYRNTNMREAMRRAGYAMHLYS